MAFDRTKLSGGIGAGSRAPILFTFADTSSTKVQIATSGYFSDIADTIKVNDIIIAVGSDGGQTLQVTSEHRQVPVTVAVV